MARDDAEEGTYRSERQRIEEALDEITERFLDYEFDPLGFVLWAYPWGKPGTDLEHEDGPEQWQIDQLTRIGDKLRAGGEMGAVIKEFISAGHGVGKSALVAWLIHWAMSREDTRGVVTAVTDGQLRGKTWAELSKWHQLYIAKELFVLTATALYSADPAHAKSWRIDAVPWSITNTEAFAGLHNKGKRILLIFDEASGIADKIWEVSEGALTDARTQILWCSYGNPTQTTGRFHKECTRPKPGVTEYHRVDSRTVRFTNKAQIKLWVDEYGEDSDFVRVRVKGQFPRAGASNFIGAELCEDARTRRVPRMAYMAHPIILSVDPARFGDDWSVITVRQGLKVHYQVSMWGFDGPDLAGRVWEILQKLENVSCIVYDANGNGADLDSALRRMPGLPPLVPVMWGVPAKDDKQYFNQRSECWGKMRDWLKAGEIPDNDELVTELTSVDYGYDALFRIQLVSKQDMKREGKKSPDHADSLALSFVPELIDRKIVTAKARPVRQKKVIWSTNLQPKESVISWRMTVRPGNFDGASGRRPGRSLAENTPGIGASKLMGVGTWITCLSGSWKLANGRLARLTTRTALEAIRDGTTCGTRRENRTARTGHLRRTTRRVTQAFTGTRSSASGAPAFTTGAWCGSATSKPRNWQSSSESWPKGCSTRRSKRFSRRRVDAVRRQDVPLRPSALPCMCPFLIGSRTCRP